MSHAQFSDFITSVVQNVLLEKTRAKMDMGIHVIQFSKESLTIGYSKGYLGNIGEGLQAAPTSAEMDEVYSIALDIIRSKTTKYNPDTFDISKMSGIYRVESWDDGVPNINDGLLLIGKTFDAIRTFLSNKISRDPRLKKSFLGVRTVELKNKKTGASVINQRSTLDIGHMASFGREEKNSPLSMKTYNVAQAFRMQGLSEDDKNAEILFQASRDIDVFLNRLKKAHIDYKCTFSKDLELAASLVGKLSFIYTTTQSAYLNQQILGQIEFGIYKELEEYLHDLRGSPSIMELIQQALLNAFWGKSKNNKKYVNKLNGSAEVLNKNVKSNGLAIVKQPQLRSASGKFFNVLKLQNLINSQLHDRLRANMGTGGDKNTLNYITGRFAKSAKVLSINQRGLGLDTYFTYMKYPYETFAPGGKQYKGDRRDPEKLIGRSIREIATNLVAGQFMIRPIVG